MTPRTVKAVTGLVLAALAAGGLTACSGDHALTFGKKQETPIVDTPPRNGAMDAARSLATEGCGDGYIDMANQVIRYFTFANKGNVTGVKTEFKDGPVVGGNKTCTITIKDADIRTDAGDLNEATITIQARPVEENPTARTLPVQDINALRPMFALYGDNLNQTKNLSPLVNDGLTYAQTNNLLSTDAHMMVYPGSQDGLVADVNGDTAFVLGTVFPMVEDGPYSSDPSGLAISSATWGTITTPDPQKPRTMSYTTNASVSQITNKNGFKIDETAASALLFCLVNNLSFSVPGNEYRVNEHADHGIQIRS